MKWRIIALAIVVVALHSNPQMSFNGGTVRADLPLINIAPVSVEIENTSTVPTTWEVRDKFGGIEVKDKTIEVSRGIHLWSLEMKCSETGSYSKNNYIKALMVAICLGKLLL